MENDWLFCVQSLSSVSRSFSLPLAMLETPVRESATCAYLLCRIVDTVEDDPHLSIDSRSKLYQAFLSFLDGKISEEEWQKGASLLSGSDSEVVLARGMGRVLKVLSGTPQEMQCACRKWIHEMCRGMEIYSLRPKGADGIRALIDLPDLYRYCYFVAGTVGHLLTELFILAHPHVISEEVRHSMVQHAESFGIGLQLVNVLKDMAKDRKAGYSFIPRHLAGVGGFERLYDPALRKEGHRMLEPIFKRAYESLSYAMQYTLLIPSELKSIRLFLLLPLGMAIATLKLAEGNDLIFDERARLAIPRTDVEKLIQICESRCQDNEALAQIFKKEINR